MRIHTNRSINWKTKCLHQIIYMFFHHLCFYALLWLKLTWNFCCSWNSTWKRFSSKRVQEKNYLQVAAVHTNTWLILMMHCKIIFRYCKRMWLAAYRCLRKPWSILLVWNSSRYCARVCAARRRTGPLDRYSLRGYRANSIACHCNKLYKLATAGWFFIVIIAMKFTS